MTTEEFNRRALEEDALVIEDLKARYPDVPINILFMSGDHQTTWRETATIKEHVAKIKTDFPEAIILSVIVNNQIVYHLMESLGAYRRYVMEPKVKSFAL